LFLEMLSIVILNGGPTCGVALFPTCTVKDSKGAPALVCDTEYMLLDIRSPPNDTNPAWSMQATGPPVFLSTQFSSIADFAADEAGGAMLLGIRWKSNCA